MSTTIDMKTITINGVEYVEKSLLSEQQVSQPLAEDGLKYAIVRSYHDGVKAGFVKSFEGRQVVLIRARQLWSWDSKFVLTDLAEFGPATTGGNKYSAEVSQETVVLDACGIIFCTNVAAKAIRAIPAQVKK